MRQELDDRLSKRWPAIFVDRHGSPEQTSMCWGFTCGDGWYPLIDVLCEALQREADQGDGPQPVAVQVKEKLGSLRFHVRIASERQRAMIDFARDISERTCEWCGCTTGMGHNCSGGSAPL